MYHSTSVTTPPIMYFLEKQSMRTKDYLFKKAHIFHTYTQVLSWEARFLGYKKKSITVIDYVAAL